VRAFVTGATGFLGHHLVAELLAAGHEVVAFSRNPSSAPTPAATANQLKIARGDVLDVQALTAAAKGCDVVFHAAGFVSRKPEDAEALHAVHVTGTRNVLQVCRDAGARRAVVASTSGVVAVSADARFIATEESETPITLLQRWPYYRAKLFAERAAFALAQPGFDVVCVNPTLLLGPGDLTGSSTNDVQRFLERKLPAVPPGGLSFVDARDAAIAMRLAADLGQPGHRYLLAACNLTIREFFGRLQRVSGVAAPVLPMPRSPDLTRAGLSWLTQRLDRAGIALPIDAESVDLGQFYWYLDASKAERDLGWAPRDPQETLLATVRDLRNRGVVWPDVQQAGA
jgi:dihydroflavonol-4-reductase